MILVSTAANSMGENGFVRFAGNLDPRAREFRPRNDNISNATQPIPLFFPPPPPLPPSHQFYLPFPSQVLPFRDASVFGCPQQHALFATPPAYVRVVAALPLQSTVPTRMLTLSSVPSAASESLLRRELEVFGEVRGVRMERIMEGIVNIYFYDLRHAEKALKEIRHQHKHHQITMRNLFITTTATSLRHSHNERFVAPASQSVRGLIAGCAVWAQFGVPSCNAVKDGQNQGTIVVFNLDPGVSNSSIREIFQAYGAVKEIRETPLKKQQRFVEFYDVRDAAKALREMDGKEVYGREVVIEFSRPGGYCRRFFDAGVGAASLKNSSNFDYNHRTRTACYVPHSPLPRTQRRSSSSCLYHNVSPRRFLTLNESSGGKRENGNTSLTAGDVYKGLSEASDVDGGAGILSSAGYGDLNRTAAKKTTNDKSSTLAGKQQHKSLKALKKKQGKNKVDNRFRIKDDAMVEANDLIELRTTVMIKNIPNKYSLKLLLNMLDNHCIHCNEHLAADEDDQPSSSYDFLYLPIDFNNRCNVGYGFVNMTSPQAARRFYKAFHLQHWEVFNTRKICEITYARVQGLEALKEHFKNSKFPCEMEDYLPVVFSPPRDGTQLTEPLPIVCQNTHPGLVRVKCVDHETDGGDSPNNIRGSSDHCQEQNLISSSENSNVSGDDDKDNSSYGSLEA